MFFNDTLVAAEASGLPLWFGRLAEHATMESTVLKHPVEGRGNILALLKHAVPLYDRHLVSRRELGSRFYLESYQARLQGTPLECFVIVHLNADGEADSLLVDHHPIEAALLLSRPLSAQLLEGEPDPYVKELELELEPETAPVRAMRATG